MSRVLNRAHAPAKLRGILVAAGVRWTRQTYGDEVMEAAIARLPEADRALFSRFVLSIGWYPLASWIQLGQHVRAELERRGQARDFHERAARGIGAGVMQTIFQSILARVSPTGLLARVPMIYGKLFDQGEVRVLENELGAARLHLQIPEEMRDFARQTLATGLIQLLAMSGAREVEQTQQEVPGGLEISYRYRAG